MAKRSGKRSGGKPAPATYTDPEGNVLALRTSMTAGTRTELMDMASRPAATPEDAWRRRNEFLFERLAASWEIAGLDPIKRQKDLLARYRIASRPEREWIDTTIREHVEEHFPELAG